MSLSTYKNHTAIVEEVNRIKSRKNLLLWYTADEYVSNLSPAAIVLNLQIDLTGTRVSRVQTPAQFTTEVLIHLQTLSMPHL